MSKLKHLGICDLLERLAAGIVAVVGPNCEVVVHDFNDLEHSVIIIAGNVSGRSPGAPVPDLEFVSSNLDENIEDQLNYRINVGSRELQSSTVWIRDDSGTPVGALCINVDYDGLLKAYSNLGTLTEPVRGKSSLVIQDTWAKDLDELIELSVSAFLRTKGGVDINSLSQADRIELIQFVEERGLFQLRGAVPRLAELLDVSRASIYNYKGAINHAAKEIDSIIQINSTKDV